MKLDWQYKTDLEKAGLKAAKFLQSQGFQALWVGGVIRDQMLKKTSDNLDIATDAKPDQVVMLLSKEKIYVKPIGKQFGSILAIVNGQKIEITTFRKEGHYSDNRHPDRVEFIKDYLEDAKRRDFTINALYFDPIKKELFDPTGKGVKDQGERIIRFVGDPKKRIDEDGLRMLRGVRLAIQLGFKLEKNSFAAIKTRAKYIQDISGERIKAELDKILLSKNRSEGLQLLDSIGLLRFIIPETQALRLFSHNSKHYHLEGNMLNHTLLALSKVKNNDLDLIYAVLFHDMGKPKITQEVKKEEGVVISTKGHPAVSAEIFQFFAEKLKFPSENKNLITWLILNHEVRPFVNKSHEEQVKFALDPRFEILMHVWQADFDGNIRDDQNSEYTKVVADGIRQGKEVLKQVKASEPLISKLAKGELIMKYGKLRPSPQLGKKIEDIKVQIVLGKIKNEKDLKTYLS